MVYAILIFMLSFVITAFSLPRILLVSYHKKLFDRPESRKQHLCLSSRLGGICFVPVLFFTFLLFCGILWHIHPGVFASSGGFSGMVFFASGLIVMYLLGFFDDLFGVGYRLKFAVQLLGGVMLWLSGIGVNHLGGLFGIGAIPQWLGFILTLLLVLYVVNAINLIDGIDGLASGLGILSLTLFVTFSIIQAQMLPLLLFSSMLGIMLPFWYYNAFRRRRRNFKLFMGDTGSLTLGYVLACGLLFHLHVFEGALPHNPWTTGEASVAIGSFVVPCFDLVRVMLVRARRGKGLFLPDRNHIHHKLLRAGFSTLSALMILLSLSLVFILCNALLSQWCGITAILAADVLIWLAFHAWLNRRMTVS